MSDRTERVSASVEEDFKQVLRIEAAKRGMSMSELIYRILRREIAGEDTVLDEVQGDYDVSDIDLDGLTETEV